MHVSIGSDHANERLIQPAELLTGCAHDASSLIIDLRPGRRYRRSHVPGSHNIPSAKLLSTDLPEGDLVLIGDTADHSLAVIEELHEQGYCRRIRHLAGGFPAWSALGLPTEPEDVHHPRLPWGSLMSQLAGGGLLVVAALAQSLALLGLGLVLLYGPWFESRARA